jgi:hypothetical protein
MAPHEAELCWRHIVTGTWEMQVQAPQMPIGAPDHNRLRIRGDQFAPDRIAPRVIRRHRHGLAHPQISGGASHRGRGWLDVARDGERLRARKRDRVAVTNGRDALILGRSLC